VGTGGGLKARVGPVQAALFENSDLAGLRAGQAFMNGDSLYLNDETYALFPLGRGVREWTLSYGSEVFSHGIASVSTVRDKDVFTETEYPLIVKGSTVPFYTQLEFAAGLVFTVRLGLNAGELVDFVLGWWRIDLFADDVGRADGLGDPGERLQREMERQRWLHGAFPGSTRSRMR
jgi:hypothetical protein